MQFLFMQIWWGIKILLWYMSTCLTCICNGVQISALTVSSTELGFPVQTSLLHQLLVSLGISITPLTLASLQNPCASFTSAWADKEIGCMLDRAPLFPTFCTSLNLYLLESINSF